MRPLAVVAGTPGTMSTQAWSVSALTRLVAPEAGSTARMRMSRWSRLSTTSSGSPDPARSQLAVTRYSSASLSQSTRVRVPSSDATCSDTLAFGVPAAG